MNREQRDSMVKQLWSWGSALDECERKQREISRLLSQAEGAENILHAQVLSSLPKGHDVGDPTGQAAVMRVEAMRRVAQLTEEINGIMQAKAAVDAAVDALPQNLRRLIHLRYVRGWGLSYKIPQALYVDRRTVQRWHVQALEKMSHNVPFLGV